MSVCLRQNTPNGGSGIAAAITESLAPAGPTRDDPGTTRQTMIDRKIIENFKSSVFDERRKTEQQSPRQGIDLGVNGVVLPWIPICLIHKMIHIGKAIDQCQMQRASC